MDSVGSIQGAFGSPRSRHECWRQHDGACPRPIEPLQTFDQYLRRENSAERPGLVSYADWIKRANFELPADAGAREVPKRAVDLPASVGSSAAATERDRATQLRTPRLGDTPPPGIRPAAAYGAAAWAPGARLIARGLSLDVLA